MNHSIQELKRKLTQISHLNSLIYNKNAINSSLLNVLDANNKVQVSEKIDPRINIVLPEVPKNPAGGLLNVLNLAFLLSNHAKIRFIIQSGSQNDIEYLNNYPKPFSEMIGSSEIISLLKEQENIISISKYDLTIATFWKTAFLASEIQKHCQFEKFFYLIQDDETLFYPASSLSQLVKNSYSLNFMPIFSREVLANYFKNTHFRDRGNFDYSSFEPPCYAKLPSFDEFRNRSTNKKIALFMRRHEHRCCSELALFTIEKALKERVLPLNLEIYCFGERDSKSIILKEVGVKIRAFSHMPLEEYRKQLSSFDLAFNLQSTPHNSMFNVDFALSGVPAITNTFSSDINTEYYSSLSQNIIAADPNPDSLIQALKAGLELSGDLQRRFKNAEKSNIPKNYSESMQIAVSFVISYFNK